MEQFFVIGLDGGGTKTEAVILDQEGTVIASGTGGSANVTFVGYEVARQSIRDAISALAPKIDMSQVKTAGSCVMVGPGETEEILRQRGFSGRFYWFSEPAVAFRCAGLLSARGVAVVAGTGSCFRVCDGVKVKEALGGWGMAVSDEGSAFDIGLTAIKAAGRSLDGRGPKTRLLELLQKEAGSERFDVLLTTYCYPALKQREVASLAKVVTEAAKDGDEVAIQILASAGESLGKDTAHVAKRVYNRDDEFDIALSGGVFNAGDLVVDSLQESVLAEFPMAKIHLPKMSAGEAAARLALESLDL